MRTPCALWVRWIWHGAWCRQVQCRRLHLVGLAELVVIELVAAGLRLVLVCPPGRAAALDRGRAAGQSLACTWLPLPA